MYDHFSDWLYPQNLKNIKKIRTIKKVKSGFFEEEKEYKYNIYHEAGMSQIDSSCHESIDQYTDFTGKIKIKADKSIYGPVENNDVS